MTGEGVRAYVDARGVLVEQKPESLIGRSIRESVGLARSIAAAIAGQALDGGQVRRLDLCCDVDAAFEESDSGSFVGRSRKHDQHRVGVGRRSVFSGWTMSPGAPVSWNVYDKRLELEARHARDGRRALEESIWRRNGWDGSADVSRVEVRLKGTALDEFGLRDPAVLEGRVDGVWRALTSRSLRMVRIGSSTRERRCELDPRWRGVQGAVFVRATDEAVGRVRRVPGAASRQQMLGVALSHLAGRGLLAGAAEPMHEFLGQRFADAVAQDPTLGARIEAARARFRGSS